MSPIRSFREFIEETIAAQPHSDTTQVGITVGSYTKAARTLRPFLPPEGTVLDYGSGLGLGTAAIRAALSGHMTVDSYEPSPARAAQTPTYTSSDQIHETYDGIICLNVLNVLEPALRDTVTRHLLHLLSPGGRAVIGTRKFTGDVSLAKSATPGKERGSVWIRRPSAGGTRTVYQKGFDGAELLQYVSRLAGPQYTVTALPGITKSAVLVTKRPETRA